MSATQAVAAQPIRLFTAEKKEGKILQAPVPVPAGHVVNLERKEGERGRKEGRTSIRPSCLLSLSNSTTGGRPFRVPKEEEEEEEALKQCDLNLRFAHFYIVRERQNLVTFVLRGPPSVLLEKSSKVAIFKINYYM